MGRRREKSGIINFDEFDRYSEDLFMAQYDVSEIISHELTKDEVREDFLISVLESCSEPKPTLVKGSIRDDQKDAGQLDIILCRPNSHFRRPGSQCLVEKHDALCLIEVKGNCTGRDLKKADSKAVIIKNLKGEQNPLCGVVCYRSELKEKTILKRFGFSFDNKTDTYFDNATIPNIPEADEFQIDYSNLDFFVSLEEEKKIFLRKYEISPGKYRFIRTLEFPLIKALFSMVRSLLAPANSTS